MKLAMARHDSLVSNQRLATETDTQTAEEAADSKSSEGVAVLFSLNLNERQNRGRRL